MSTKTLLWKIYRCKVVQFFTAQPLLIHCPHVGRCHASESCLQVSHGTAIVAHHALNLSRICHLQANTEIYTPWNYGTAIQKSQCTTLAKKIETATHAKLQAHACSSEYAPVPQCAQLSQFFWPGQYINIWLQQSWLGQTTESSTTEGIRHNLMACLVTYTRRCSFQSWIVDYDCGLPLLVRTKTDKRDGISVIVQQQQQQQQQQ